MRKIVARPLTIVSAAVVGLAAMIAIGSGVSAAAPAHVPAAPVAHSVALEKVASKPNGVRPANLLVVHTTVNSVNIRGCASTSCPIVGTANTSDTIDSWCFVIGQDINGNFAWDLLYDKAANRGGFITESLLNNTTQSSTC